jgi:hypothetical protein
LVILGAIYLFSFVFCFLNKTYLQEANEMINSNPEHPKGHVRKGGVLFFTDDFPGAIEEYRKGSLSSTAT